MSKTKKPKAGRVFVTCNMILPANENYPANATLIPDGAPIPLPADVRRVLLLVDRLVHANLDAWHTCYNDLLLEVRKQEKSGKWRKGGGK